MEHKHITLTKFQKPIVYGYLVIITSVRLSLQFGYKKLMINSAKCAYHLINKNITIIFYCSYLHYEKLGKFNNQMLCLIKRKNAINVKTNAVF